MDRDHRPDRADPEPAADGWLGTEHLPGYRAGAVVVKLDELPAVDPDHLYVDVILLASDGAFLDHHSGPCAALGRTSQRGDRLRFVRVVAELVRHVSLDTRGLAPIGQALRLIRERGVEAARSRDRGAVDRQGVRRGRHRRQPDAGPRVVARQRGGAAPDAACRHAARARVGLRRARRRLRHGFAARCGRLRAQASERAGAVCRADREQGPRSPLSARDDRLHADSDADLLGV